MSNKIVMVTSRTIVCGTQPDREASNKSDKMQITATVIIILQLKYKHYTTNSLLQWTNTNSGG